jgi:hypothetical protein
MSELMGMLDVLDSFVAGGSRIPMTGKIVLEEQPLVQILRRLRHVLENGERTIRQTIEVSADVAMTRPQPPGMSALEIDSLPVLEDAARRAAEMRQGAREYADQVLANLELVVAKLSKEVAKVERHIQNGRATISTTTQGDPDHAPR